MRKSIKKQQILNLFIASKVYMERTVHLLEPGVGLLTDPMPKQDDTRLLIMETELAIEIFRRK